MVVYLFIQLENLLNKKNKLVEIDWWKKQNIKDLLDWS